MAQHSALRATVEAFQQFGFQVTSQAGLQDAVAASLAAVDGKPHQTIGGGRLAKGR